MTARRAPSRWRSLLEWLAVLGLGAVAGSALAGLGAALLGDGPVVSAITRTWPIGVRPAATLDLRVLSLTFGASLEVGVLTVAGSALAAWLYRRAA